jgi:type I restriction enzyme, S subunit
MPHVGGANIESQSGKLTDLQTARQERLKSGKFVFDETMVLYSKIRPYLMKVTRPDFKGLCSADIYPLSPDSTQLDRDYLFHLLLTPKFTEFAISGSARAGMPKVNRDHLFTFQVRLPPLSEQRRIASILDEAFDSIATAKANAEKNLQNARALFESQLQAVFVEDGGKWVKRTLGALASFRNGINYTKDSKGQRVKIVGVKDFQKNFWIPSENLDTVVIDGELNELDRLQKGDVLAVRSNGNPELIGRCMIAGDVHGKVSHSGFTIRIRLSNSDVLPQYLCHFMKRPSLRRQLTDSGTGTNIKSLNQQTLSNLIIPVPSIPEQNVIVAKLESFSKETRRLESIYRRKLAALDELKKTLLHKAFAGEL